MFSATRTGEKLSLCIWIKSELKLNRLHMCNYWHLIVSKGSKSLCNFFFLKHNMYFNAFILERKLKHAQVKLKVENKDLSQSVWHYSKKKAQSKQSRMHLLSLELTYETVMAHFPDSCRSEAAFVAAVVAGSQLPRTRQQQCSPFPTIQQKVVPPKIFWMKITKREEGSCKSFRLQRRMKSAAAQTSAQAH